MLAYDGLNARICRKCGCEKSHVFDSRDIDDLLKRRRECLKCGFRWSTVEVEEITFDRITKAYNNTTTSEKGGNDNV